MEQREAKHLVQALAPGRVVLASWAVLAALLLVFAADIRQWAEASEQGSIPASCTPLAASLERAMDAAYVVPVRRDVQSSIQAFYDQPVLLAAREQAELVKLDELGATASAAQQQAPREGAPGAVAGDLVSGLPQPLRILLIGDSTIQEGLGTELERLLESYKDLSVYRFGKYSTGLARPDYFNWREKITELKAEFEPDLIIAHWGDNDCQGLSTEAGEFICHFGTDEWDQIYSERSQAIIKLMQEGGAGAVVVGLPIMRSKNFSNKVERLNQVVEKAVTSAGGVFIPTWEMTSDADGKYMSKVEFNGANRIIRASDGIHLSTHGSAYVADGIVAALKEHYYFEQTGD
jgi:hypothetical protein